MESEQDKQKDLIDTTDCLEAVGVFRGWKNFLFVFVIFCMLLLQIAFWLVNTRLIEMESQAVNAKTEAITGMERVTEIVKNQNEEIEKAAEEVVAQLGEPNEVILKQTKSEDAKFHFSVKFKYLAWFINLLNFLLIIAAMLYCLTMLFCLKVSLIGRLGGINHISRAFFISLVFLVLLLPWQIPWHKCFAGEIFGAIYTPYNLHRSFAALKDSGLLYKVFYYFRFTGYWAIALLPLIFSHIRSCRWAKATLRRLEVI